MQFQPQGYKLRNKKVKFHQMEFITFPTSQLSAVLYHSVLHLLTRCRWDIRVAIRAADTRSLTCAWRCETGKPVQGKANRVTRVRMWNKLKRTGEASSCWAACTQIRVKGQQLAAGHLFRFYLQVCGCSIMIPLLDYINEIRLIIQKKKINNYYFYSILF